MSTKTNDKLNLYTFHLSNIVVEAKKGFVVKGKFIVRSNRNEHETKEFYFRRFYGYGSKNLEKSWSIKTKSGQPIGKNLYKKLHICLSNIVEQFGQVIPADDAFEFDFNTEGVLGQQIN